MYAQVPLRVVPVRIGKQLSRVVTLLILLAVSGAAQVPLRDTLVVSVKSDSGKPLPDVIVRLLRPNAPRMIFGRTDSGGVAKLSPVPPDTFSIEALRIGFQRARMVVGAGTDSVTMVIRSSAVDFTDVVVCTMHIQPAIVLELDSAIATGKVTAMVRVRDGSYEETQQVELPDQTSAGLAPERRGTYRIEVTAPGYKPWRRDGVAVSGDACHVDPKIFRVRLIPAKR